MANKLNKEKIAQLRQDIADGHVDIGPFPAHAPMSGDTRDLRDPKTLGEAIITVINASREQIQPGKTRNATDLIRGIDYSTVRQYNPSDSLVQSSVARRQQELRDRAAQGDRYAISMLAGEAYSEPSDDIRPQRHMKPDHLKDTP